MQPEKPLALELGEWPIRYKHFRAILTLRNGSFEVSIIDLLSDRQPLDEISTYQTFLAKVSRILKSFNSCKDVCDNQEQL